MQQRRKGACRKRDRLGGSLAREREAIPPPQNEMIADYIPKEEERNEKQREK